MRRPLLLFMALFAWCSACGPEEDDDAADEDDDDGEDVADARAWPSNERDASDARARDAAVDARLPGITCSSDPDCLSSQYCAQGSCLARGREGSSCTRDSACTSGLSCLAGMCTACPTGQERICISSEICTCGPVCGDALPACSTGTSCGRFTADPTRGVCATQSFWTSRCGGCNEDERCNEQAKCEPVPLPSSGVLTHSLARKEGVSGFVYDVDVALVAFDEQGKSTEAATLEVQDVEDDDFVAHWGEVACKVTLVESSAKSVSVPLVMDQSGSITGTDPSDVRIPAAKAFLSSLGALDQSALLSFAQGNGCSMYDVTLYGMGFRSDHTGFFGTLDTLAGCEGGGTPLYDAVAAGVDLVLKQGERDAKAVLVFTDGDDTASKSSESQVIQQALNGSVKLFTIGLSDGVNHRVLANLARRTGGAYFQANQVGSAISAFRGMNQLLTGSYHRYDCKNSLTVTVPADQTPGWMSTSIGVTVAGKRVWTPLRLDF